MLGYDVRRYQLAAFVLGGALAALSRRALHRLGPVHHAEQHGADGGGAAGHLGRRSAGARTSPRRWSARSLVLALFQQLTIRGSQYALVVMGAAPARDGALRARGARRSPLARRHRAAAEARDDASSRPAASPSASAASMSRATSTSALEPGEIHCLIGPNGAGKSSFFRLVLGMHQPDKRRDPASRARTSPACARSSASAAASASSSRCRASSRRCRCGRTSRSPSRTTCTATGSTRRSGGSSTSPASARRPARPAGTLSHGQKQWLEIGMAVGRRAEAAAPRRADRRHVAGGDRARPARCCATLNARGHHHPRGRARHDLRPADRDAGHGAAFRRHLRGGHRRRGRSPTRASRRSISGPPMPDETLLSVAGLRGGYGASPVLLGVDLEVGKGEVVAVIGRNGVGKTTLMRTLCGLLPRRRRAHPLPRPRRDGRAGRPPRPQRPRLHPAGPRRLPDADRRARTCSSPRRRAPAAGQAGLRAGLPLLPGPEGARAPVGRHAVGRPAAAARHRPRA